MRKREILTEPTLKLALTHQMLRPDYYDDLLAPPPSLTKIILTRYNNQELRKQHQAFMLRNGASDYPDSVSQLLGDSLTWSYKNPSAQSSAAQEDAICFRASDGFQQIDVKMDLADPKKLSLFNMREQFEHLSHSSSFSNAKHYKCLFTNITKYVFHQAIQYESKSLADEGSEDHTSKSQSSVKTRKCYILIIKDFKIHSMQEKLNADILQPPELEDLPKLPQDQEIKTYIDFINHLELKKKAQRMNILFPPSPDIKFDVDPMIMLLAIKQEEKELSQYSHL